MYIKGVCTAGNLVHRSVSMMYKHCGQSIPYISPHTPTSSSSPALPEGAVVGSPLQPADTQLLSSLPGAVESCRRCMDDYQLYEYIHQACAVIHAGNKYMDEQSPWVLAKPSSSPADKQRLHSVLYVITAYIRCIVVLLTPVIPHSCGLLWEMYQFPSHLRSLESLSGSQEHIGISGIRIRTPTHIFPRIKT